MDLLASDLFEKFNNQFNEILWKEIYRDNGFLVFKGKKLLLEIKRLRYDYQSRVNEIIGNEYLQIHMQNLDAKGNPVQR